MATRRCGGSWRVDDKGGSLAEDFVRECLGTPSALPDLLEEVRMLLRSGQQQGIQSSRTLNAVRSWTSISMQMTKKFRSVRRFITATKFLLRLLSAGCGWEGVHRNCAGHTVLNAMPLWCSTCPRGARGASATGDKVATTSGSDKRSERQHHHNAEGDGGGGDRGRGGAWC